MSKNAKRRLKEILDTPAPEPPKVDFEEKLRSDAYHTKLPWPPNKADAQYRAQRDAYFADMGRLTEEFKRDMFAHYGVTGHPKVEIAYRIAWGHGHASGFTEVDIYFAELVELLQPDHC